jgi:predicted membrane channel-forming protein YqfA (hemolysin III family)
MEWLDFIEMLSNHDHPIEDIDGFLNYATKWPLFAHMITAALCLGFSAIYHLMFIYSHEAQLLLAKLDYIGIILLMFGSVMPPINYAFACQEV